MSFKLVISSPCRTLTATLMLLLAVACSADEGANRVIAPLDADVLADGAEDAGLDTADDPSDGAADFDVDVVYDMSPSDVDVADSPSIPTPPDRPEISSSRLEQLQFQLRGILDDASVAGRRLTALVVEEETGRVLFESDPDLALAPASNTKLFTTAAALALLGEDYRFRTRIYADEVADGLGVINGDIYLVGAHDFTFSAQINHIIG